MQLRSTMTPEEKLIWLRTLIQKASWEVGSDDYVLAEFPTDSWDMIVSILECKWPNNA